MFARRERRNRVGMPRAHEDEAWHRVFCEGVESIMAGRVHDVGVDCGNETSICKGDMDMDEGRVSRGGEGRCTR